MLFEMFHTMSDDDLQSHHDMHIELFEEKDVEPSMGEVLAEYSEELRAEEKEIK